MWYYKITDQQFGPFSTEEIRQLLLEGTIDPNTPIRCEGSEDWKALGEADLTSIENDVNTSEESTPLGLEISDDHADSNSKEEKIGDHGYRTKLKELFTIWVIVIIFNTGIDVIFSLLNKPLHAEMRCLNTLMGSVAGILSLVLLYRFWQVDQDGEAATTPGKAVEYLFIPIYNMYWAFRTGPGLSLDQNRYIARHFDHLPENTVRKARPIIAYIYVAFPLLYILIYFIWLFFILGIKDFYMMNQSELASLSMRLLPFKVGSAVISLILGILTYSDFYKTAVSICEAKEKYL